ncbi:MULTISPECIES: DUF2807 domain-containing protein [Pontibacillus]|uniref:DUF2807 domain-containing protein n=1 Tax=Pontibacillus chungwhensis TaxID=265426 RepID=A0ABY8UX41_9BACI|nr:MULTISPECIES: DUF2807 domain-containing protein [Pontibacillus]MCD5325681.1 DUF2807 domain-containing protein [Pontibacillus sp. HN14]WIF98077.1 DUF2807 domain-containing protein [Pontibacillus chungwhensis]
MKNQHRWNEQGIALPIVLMVFVVLSVLGLGLMGLVLNNTKMTSGERNYQASYYIAEAGITQRMKNVEDRVTFYYQNTNEIDSFYDELEKDILKITTFDSFESAFDHQPEANMKIEKVNNQNPRTYRISSKGVIGQRSRTVEKLFYVNWKEKGGLSIPSEMAVFTETNISLKGGANIKGNVGTNSDDSGTISFSGGTYINGDIYVPKGAENRAIDAKHYMDISRPIPIEEPTPFELPPFPTYPQYPVYPDERIGTQHNKHDVIKDGKLSVDSWLADGYTLKLDQSATFTEIKMGSNNTLNVDVGDKDKSIVVDHLNVSNGHINIIGSGNLTIYVKDEITMGSGSTINQGGSISKLNVYLKDSHKARNVKLSGSQMIYGSLYAETADIEITGGGGFQGHIFTGGDEVKISGGARTYSSILYAPNANFTITGGGSVFGTVLSRSFDASGGAYVEYKEVDLSDIPFTPSGGGDVPEDLVTSEPLRESN